MLVPAQIFFGVALNAVKLLVWSYIFGTAQNNLGPVEGQALNYLYFYEIMYFQNLLSFPAEIWKTRV